MTCLKTRAEKTCKSNISLFFKSWNRAGGKRALRSLRPAFKLALSTPPLNHAAQSYVHTSFYVPLNMYFLPPSASFSTGNCINAQIRVRNAAGNGQQWGQSGAGNPSVPWEGFGEGARWQPKCFVGSSVLLPLVKARYKNTTGHVNTQMKEKIELLDRSGVLKSFFIPTELQARGVGVGWPA